MLEKKTNIDNLESSAYLSEIVWSCFFGTLKVISWSFPVFSNIREYNASFPRWFLLVYLTRSMPTVNKVLKPF